MQKRRNKMDALSTQKQELLNLMQDIGSQEVIELMIEIIEEQKNYVLEDLEDARDSEDIYFRSKNIRKREIEKCRYVLANLKDDIKMLKKVHLSGEEF
jgi:N-methylhydantoinase B/oxoprolinase/acetone carboxylase alpha subunit